MTILEPEWMNVKRLLWHMGEDPDREGLQNTPQRVVAMYGEMTAGYQMDVASILATQFEVPYGGMVVVTGVWFASLCEHHLLPFTGRAAVGYLPGEKVVGLSKLARLVNVYARRLQVQERMTEQIADALEEHLQPQGAGVLIRAHHACMGIRGALQADAYMTTSSLRGAIKDEAEARAEFLELARDGVR